MSSTPVHDLLAAPLPGAKTGIKSTTCYMCACRCGINVHVRDGQARYIEGNHDHPLNKGVICAKGGSGIMKQYSPARLTRPLRRKTSVKVRNDELYRADNPHKIDGAVLVPAFAMQYGGLLAERWYFFAEANHPQNIYYQTIG